MAVSAALQSDLPGHIPQDDGVVIKVYPGGKLDIIFNGGYTIVEQINLK